MDVFKISVLSVLMVSVLSVAGAQPESETIQSHQRIKKAPAYQVHPKRSYGKLKARLEKKHHHQKKRKQAKGLGDDTPSSPSRFTLEELKQRQQDARKVFAGRGSEKGFIKFVEKESSVGRALWSHFLQIGPNLGMEEVFPIENRMVAAKRMRPGPDRDYLFERIVKSPDEDLRLKELLLDLRLGHVYPGKSVLKYIKRESVPARPVESPIKKIRKTASPDAWGVVEIG